MIAFVFPGQGSQKVGMGRELAAASPECRAVFDEADAALGESLSGLCFDGPEDRLVLTENTQPAILTVSVAASRLLASAGIRPDIVAGHSLGEYSANVVAGTLSFADAVRTVRRRGRYMQEAVPVGTGAMAAVLGLGRDEVAAACAEAADGEVVEPANLNAPGQVVIAGTAAAVARAGERAKARGAKRVIPLPVSAPFHCALMKPAAERLAAELAQVPVADPTIPVVRNVDAGVTRTARDVVPFLLAQVASPVRWTQCVQRLAAVGATTFVEVGPGRVLTALTRRIADGAKALSVEDPTSLENALAAVKA